MRRVVGSLGVLITSLILFGAGVEGAGCPCGEPATASRWIVGLVVVPVTRPSAIELVRRVAPFLARRASTASRLDPIARLGMVDDPEPRRGMA